MIDENQPEDNFYWDLHDWASPEQTQLFYQFLTVTGQSDSVDLKNETYITHREVFQTNPSPESPSDSIYFKKVTENFKAFDRRPGLPEDPTVHTYGSASIMGKAVSWILDGLLKPMLYTPWSNCGLLETRQRDGVFIFDASYAHN